MPIVARSSVDNGFKQVLAELLDMVVASRENLRDTVIKDGLHSSAEIYGSEAA